MSTLFGPEQALLDTESHRVVDYLANAPGLVRRSYVTFQHGTMAHLYQRTFKLEGEMSLCGKVGGIRQRYADVKDREMCARCWRRLRSRRA